MIIFPISMSIHYANEYADHDTDALTKRAPFSGGSGALPESGLPPHAALVAAWVNLLIGIGVALVGLRWGLLLYPALSVLVFGVFFGWMYSMPVMSGMTSQKC